MIYFFNEGMHHQLGEENEFDGEDHQEEAEA